MSDEATAPGELPDDIAEQMAVALAAQKAREEAEAAEAAAREAAEAEARAAAAAAFRADMEKSAAETAAKAEADAKAEAEALAASLATLQAANADAVPIVFPVDTASAPRNKAGVGMFGPTFAAELQAAGVSGLPFAVSGDHVTFDPSIAPADRARVVAVITAHDPDQVEAVDLVAYAKAARDRHEEGGITVGGVPVATDDRSKTLLTGARLRVEKDPALVTSFAALDGQVYPLTAPMILAVSDAIGAFVAELFEAYAGIMADLKAGTIKTTAEIDARYGALDVAF